MRCDGNGHASAFQNAALLRITAVCRKRMRDRKHGRMWKNAETHFHGLIRLTNRLPAMQNIMPRGAMCGNVYARGCCTLHWISHGHTALHSGRHAPVFEGDDVAHSRVRKRIRLMMCGGNAAPVMRCHEGLFPDIKSVRKPKWFSNAQRGKFRR